MVYKPTYNWGGAQPCIDMGGSINGGFPIAEWFIRENPEI